MENYGVIILNTTLPGTLDKGPNAKCSTNKSSSAAKSVMMASPYPSLFLSLEKIPTKICLE